MIRAVDTDVILAELSALAGEPGCAHATLAVLACMDVVDRHAKIVDEHEIAARLQVEPVPSLIVQHSRPEILPDRGGRSFRRGSGLTDADHRLRQAIADEAGPFRGVAR